MTFKEYLEQPDASRLSSGSVIVTPEDCSSIVSYGGVKEVTLNFGFAVYGYTTKKPHNLPDYKNQKGYTLYTTDGDGNPKNASVFKFFPH